MTALAAVKFDVFELGEDAGPTSDDASNADEAVEVVLTEVAEGEGGGELGNSDVNLRVDGLVRGVVEEDRLQGDLIKEREHRLRRIGEEVGKNGARGTEVQEGHFEGFRVD